MMNVRTTITAASVLLGLCFVGSTALADPYSLSPATGDCPATWVDLVTWDANGNDSVDSGEGADACWGDYTGNPSTTGVASNGFTLNGELFEPWAKLDFSNSGTPTTANDFGTATTRQVGLDASWNGGNPLTGTWSFNPNPSVDVDIRGRAFLLVFKQSREFAVFLFNGIVDAVTPYSGTFNMTWAAPQDGGLSNLGLYVSEREPPPPSDPVPLPPTLWMLVLAALLVGTRRAIRR